jgi:quinol monooxygenase YgiN
MSTFATRFIALIVFGVLSGVCMSGVSAAEVPIVVVVKLYPAEGREDEAQARLTSLAKFVPANSAGVTFKLHRSVKQPVVFLLYETFPSQAALDSQSKTVLPAFFKEFGATPPGLFTKPNEVDLYRAASD